MFAVTDAVVWNQPLRWGRVVLVATLMALLGIGIAIAIARRWR